MSDIRTIKPIRIKGGSKLPIRGKELDDNLTSRVGILASSGSGKTTALAHLLKHTIDKRTTLIVFCPTIDIDPIWQHITAWCKRKKIKVLEFHDIIDEDTKENIVEFMFKKIENKEPITEEEEEEDGVDGQSPNGVEEINIQPDNDGIGRGIVSNTIKQDEETDKPKKRKPKPPVDRVPKYVWVFDDQPQQVLQKPWLYNMLKKSRKHDSRVYIISQSIIDLRPNTKAQLTDLYLYPSFDRDYVKRVYSMLRTTIPFENFWEAFLEVTKEKYAFMNINLTTGKIRKNFDEPY